MAFDDSIAGGQGRARAMEQTRLVATQIRRLKPDSRRLLRLFCDKPLEMVAAELEISSTHVVELSREQLLRQVGYDLETIQRCFATLGDELED